MGHQGKGIGSKMLQVLMDTVDKNDHVCYLETAKKRNVKLYKRFGFIVLHKERICETGPFLRFMKVLCALLYATN